MRKLVYSFIIRRAAEADAEDIRKVMQESFKVYMHDAGVSGTMDALLETEEDIRQDIRTKDVFIALIDNNPVGTIRVDCTGKDGAYISRFGVRPDFHNIGIGKSLMNLVDKLMMSRGIYKVSLHTASNYMALVRFYYGRGFYIDSVSKDRGYPRALMVKRYT